MNNKVLVELIVPLLEEKYEVYIPINKRISSVTRLLSKALNESTSGYYPIKSNSVIIDGKTGNVYDINIMVKEAKIMNGSTIVLI